MTVASSPTFRSGDSEAVRLPRDVAVGADVEVTIVRSGDVMTIFPKRPSSREMVDRLRSLPGPDRIQPLDEDIVPERPDL